jgi:hypothetical protein
MGGPALYSTAPDNAPALYVKLIMLGVEEPGVSVIAGILLLENPYF